MKIEVSWGQMALVLNQMDKKTDQKQEELNRKRDEYQTLFELAPCYITVQDKNLRLIRYNREFADKFSPETGDYCYQAYKGRSERCKVCPVLKTFEDGKPHSSEETGVSKDGTNTYWVVRSAPIKNAKGEIVAAMEMSLDVTQVRFLEEEVEKSENKYQTIFNTIPNPVFVLDRKTLDILDCNESATVVYGFNREEVLMTSFLDLFEETHRKEYASEIKSSNIVNKAKHLRRDGQIIYVNIRISSSEYAGQEVLLVTTSDITERLMAEQQLIQASKMATLGEMATGVAHELNQPLSVIKTASSFIIKKVRKNEAIQDDILKTLAEEIDSHVDRASKIITHMREFGRKSDVERKKVRINETLEKALEIFNQQLKLREIKVVKEFEKDLPPILADSNRLEQVFINLLINARDALEEKSDKADNKGQSKKIFLKTGFKNGLVIIEVKDTGVGIPKSILDKIFEPFFTTKKVGKGTGLGLSISYGIVQDYGGHIHAESQEGVGSNFVVHFPVPSEAK
jgi:histidine kinase